MSVNIPTHFVQQYTTNIELLLQQRGSKLRNTVMTGAHFGKQAVPVDQIGAIAATKVTGRFQPMGRVDAPTDRRWVFPNDYSLPQLIDNFDKLRLITDPTSSYVTNAVNALGRAMDDEIVDAYFGTAKTGENGSTNTSFGSSQDVGVGIGGAASGLNVEKLKAAREILMANEVDMDSDEIYCIITAEQDRDLLNEIQVISTDYRSAPVLEDGMLRRFLGINFVHCERLPVDGDSYRRVPFYAKSGMHLGMWNDITTDVRQRGDLESLPYQIYAHGTFGATRLEEKKIVEIKCAEA